MPLVVGPATSFDDLATLLGPKRDPDASVCWCLSHRLPAATHRALTGRARGEYVRELTTRAVAPGVVAHDDGEPVGWAAVAPRSELPFARSRTIPHVDDLPVWSVWCFRVRAGHRGRGSRVPCSPEPSRTPGSRGRRPSRATRWTTGAPGST